MKRTKKQAQKQPKKPRLDAAAEAKEDAMEVVAQPTRRAVAAATGGVGLDEALTDDALMAVCRQVHAGADLVRLSCVSRTLHRLIAHPTHGAPVWRELFRRERGPAAYAAMSALVQLHGADDVRHVFVADRQKRRQAMAGEAEEAAALPQSSVWCEAFIETDEKLAWRRLLADVASDRASGLEELAKATALMKFRDTVEARIAAWIGDDELDNDDENEDDNQKNEDEEEKAETKDLSKDEDEEEEEVEEEEYDEDKLAKSEPKLDTDLQKMQVRMLLNMMRVTGHSDVSCGDEYRGRFSASKKNVKLVFLRDNTVSSVESSGGDGQYDVTTCGVSLSVGSGKAHGKGWKYATNSARDDNPDCSPKSWPQLQQLWERLLKPSASDNGEDLTYRQFLHFLGVALDLDNRDDYERGYTAFHSFLDLAPTK